MTGYDVRARSVVFDFAGTGGIPADVGVVLDVEPGTSHAIIGPSASGKTTLVRAILGLLRPVSGSIRVGPFTMPLSSAAQRRAFTGTVGWIPQDAVGSLDPRLPLWRSVTEGVALKRRVTRTEARDIACRCLEDVGLSTFHADRLPSQLSGGQCQRACIARALAVEPELVIADEPLSALDPILQCQVLDLLAEVRARTRATFVVVSHGMAAIREFCDTVSVMKDGMIVESGPVDEVLERPKTAFTRRFVRAERLERHVPNRSLTS